MAIDYAALLTDEQKRYILNQRIQGFAADAWQNQINKDIAIKVGDDVALAEANKNLATLDLAIEMHQAELAALPPVEPQPVPEG